MQLVFTGDTLLTRSIAAADRELLELVRGGDVAFTNVETLFHDYEHPGAHEAGGTYMRAAPELARELAAAGFDLVSVANNHAGDYGGECMRRSVEHLRAAGIACAGFGACLAAAREPVYRDTPNGRIALIAATSTFPDHARAGRTRGDMPARPGINPLRYRQTHLVRADQYAALRALLRELRLDPVDVSDREMIVLRCYAYPAGYAFRIDERTDVATEPLEEDLAELAQSVANASRLADHTLVSLHVHEGDRARFVPAPFMELAARRLIDAGADAVIGHGPHVLRGLELYRGRPIFYSLGNFVFQNETVHREPCDAYEQHRLTSMHGIADLADARTRRGKSGFPAIEEYWESIVVQAAWSGDRLAALQLVPIELGFGEPRSRRGTPRRAHGAAARRILERLAEYSARYGTRIALADDTGTVVLA